MDNDLWFDEGHVQNTLKLIKPFRPYKQQRVLTRIAPGLYIGHSTMIKRANLDHVLSISTTVINCSGVSVGKRLEDCGFTVVPASTCDLVECVQSFRSEGEAVVFYSSNGYKGAAIGMCGYLIRRFRWTADKSMQLVSFFLPPLRLDEKIKAKLVELWDGMDSNNWKSTLEYGEEVLVYNTFVNSHYIVSGDKPQEELKEIRSSLLKKQKRTFQVVHPSKIRWESDG